MKDNLIGRIVGFEVPHQPHPSHLKPGRTPRLKRTVWRRVKEQSAGGANVLTETFMGVCYVIPVAEIHTVMPESY